MQVQYRNDRVRCTIVVTFSVVQYCATSIVKALQVQYYLFHNKINNKGNGDDNTDGNGGFDNNNMVLQTSYSIAAANVISIVQYFKCYK